MRLRWVTVLAATTMVVSSLAAQGAGRWGGHRIGGQGFDPSSMPIPEEIDGPPTPDTLRQLSSVTKDRKKAREDRRQHRYRGDGDESPPGSS